MQQDHTAFEVIVVADPLGLPIAGATCPAARLVPFDKANISEARNAGLALAGGELAAFIDDDAVAEPSWLGRLCAPFSTAEVVAATGFVRGRNGISYQWKACEVDHLGQDHPLDIAGLSLRNGTPLRAVKTQGTNCAFRLSALRKIGGFDPAYRFYLDEADVNIRMADLGLTAIVPDAEVLHFYEQSSRRSPARLPLSLHDIAASTAVFLRRHAGKTDLSAGLERLQDAQAARLDKLTAKRVITTDQSRDLLQTLAAGWQEGLSRPLPEIQPILNVSSTFAPLPDTGPRGGSVIAGRIWQKRRLHQKAAALRSAGQVVSVICLAPSPRAHKMLFTDDGVWWQQGGLFGRAERSGSWFQWITFSRRVAAITLDMSRNRPIK